MKHFDTQEFRALFELGRIRRWNSSRFVGIWPGLDLVYTYCAEQARMHQCSAYLVEEAPSRVLVVEYVMDNGLFGQTTLDGGYSDEYRRWLPLEQLCFPVVRASRFDNVPKDEAQAVASHLQRCRCAASRCGRNIVKAWLLP